MSLQDKQIAALKHSLIEASALASAHATRIKTLETALKQILKAAEARRGEGNSRLLFIIDDLASAALASPSSETTKEESPA